MAELDFPDNPADLQVHPSGRWRWSAAKQRWELLSPHVAPTMTLNELKSVLKEYFDAFYWQVPGLPANAYTIPGGGDGYYYTEGDYYTAPPP